MRLLVTGGAGYIGSHFCKWASRAGHEVIAYDNLSTGHREFALFGPLVEGDIRDTNKVTKALSDHSVQAVVHFAASALVAESVDNPDLYFDNNVEGTRSLLHAMKKATVTQILMSSTAAVYGDQHMGLINEDDIKSPINPYGESKKQCEELLFDFHKTGGKVGILRYFNVIGRDPEGELWEWHEPETHVLPNLVKAIKEGKEFTLFGTDLPTDDGTCVRDYVNVNDLTKAHLVALEQKDTHFISNIGQGKGHSIKEVISTAENVLGKKAKIKYCDRRPGDPPHLVANNAFFRTWYHENMTSLEESIQSLES